MSRNAGRRRALQATTRRCQSSIAPRRYGQANEPPPYLGGGKGFGPPTTDNDAPQEEKALPKIGENLQKDGERERERDHSDEPQREHEPIIVQGQSRPAASDPMFDATEAASKNDKTDKTEASSDKPADSLLDTVMDPAKHEQEGHSTPSGSGSDPGPTEPSTSLQWVNPNLREEHTPSIQSEESRSRNEHGKTLNNDLLL